MPGSFNPNINYNQFEENNFGLYLDIESSGHINSTISHNAFIKNNYGMGTFAKINVTGMALPALSYNSIDESSQFPIFINGSTSLEYMETEGEQANTFANNVHRAIALGGYFGSGYRPYILPAIPGDSNLPFSGKPFPFAVMENTTFDHSTTANIVGDLVFKFDQGQWLKFLGTLNMSSDAVHKNYFTSYKDDYYDDTDATPNPNPVRGDWAGVYIAGPLTPNFNYSVIKYSTDGLVILQDGFSAQNLTLEIANNWFEENRNGLTLRIEANYDISPMVANNIFINNDYGLHTYTDQSKAHHYGLSNPILIQNTFQNQSEFPIHLQGSSDPTYTGNIFSGNIHPAIALGGYWSRDADWQLVLGDNGNYFPYVILENLTEEIPADLPFGIPTIMIPANAIIKFDDGRYLYVYGWLDFMSSADNEIIFTSYKDDTFAGDTNADGMTIPARNAWKTIWFLDFPGKINNIHDFKAYYATAAIGYYYDGPENTQIIPTIENVFFNNNSSCIALALGWKAAGPGAGNIVATLKNIEMDDNNYGLLTSVHSKAIGTIFPILENVSFLNTAFYPIYLGGTSYPSFVNSNTIGNSDSANIAPQSMDRTEVSIMDLVIDGFNLPGNAAAFANIQPEKQPLVLPETPLANLSSVGDLTPAVGLTGAWNNSGELPPIQPIPYAVVGNFPLTIVVGNVSYTPANDVTIGELNPEGVIATVTVPGGTIFKLGPSRKIDVKGDLDLGSTASNKILFTSIKDDSAGGDTNRDGASTIPNRGDWAKIELNSSYTEFRFAIVRYADIGLHIYFDGPITQNISPYVHDSAFYNNNIGIKLEAHNNGDILSTIDRNKFYQNGTHILGSPRYNNSLGRLCIQAYDNDLAGNPSQNGIDNQNTNLQITDCTFDARHNYWGHPTGPYHPLLNQTGQGSKVSDRVLFDPWNTESTFPPVLPSIFGRVTLDTVGGEGLPGVSIQLSNGSQTITDLNGYYRFDDLNPGRYWVTPYMLGYSFDPLYITIADLIADTEANFIAEIAQNNVKISINSFVVFRPRSTAPKVYAIFTVSLSQALPPNTTAKINYATQDGTAVAGQDYIQKSGTLTFYAGQSLEQTIQIEIKPRVDITDIRNFAVILSSPQGVEIMKGVGVCTIKSYNMTFIPIIRH